MPEKISIRKPDDFHVHLRQGEQMPGFTRIHAAWFSRALVMPNTVPPIDTVKRLFEYRAAINAALPSYPNFSALMSFYIKAPLSRGEIIQFKEGGAVCGKLYPRGVTTHSEQGVGNLSELDHVLSAMEEQGLVLSIHGEDPSCPVADRERAFLPQVIRLSERFPELRIVLEHVSTKEAVDLVSELHHRIGATITVHHLLFTEEDLYKPVFNPHLFCKPILQKEKDREALRAAAVSGNPSFFFGSDSAPHPREKKELPEPAAGVFSAPVAMPLLAHVFEEEEALDRLETFCSRFGAEFYGLPLTEDRLTLKKKSYEVPDIVCGAVPLMAGKEIAWSLTGNRNSVE